MATFAKRNGRVTATVRIKPHPSQSKTFDTLRDAKAWAKELEVKLSAEKQGDYSHITLKIALERYRDEVIPSHRGADRDINRINRIITRDELPMDKPLQNITKYDLLEWRDSRTKEVKGSSVTRDMSLISAFFNLCVKEWGYIKVNPIADASKPASSPHRERVISQSEIDAMLQQMQQINDDKVFILEVSTLDAYFRKARKQAGLEGFTFHDTRHTAATRIAQKLKLLDLCKMFGWQDPNKAMIYYNPTATEIADLL